MATKLRWEFPQKEEIMTTPLSPSQKGKEDAQECIQVRNCLHGYDEKGVLRKVLYCSRDGRFFVRKKDGWSKLEPSTNPASTYSSKHPSGTCGSTYPNMRQYGNKHCHLLMAHAWHGPRPEGMQCDHLNGNKLDWSADNLQWVTTHENWRRRAIMNQLRKLGLDPKWLYYHILRGLYSLPTEQAELVINRFRFEAGTQDDALTTERINSTFAFLLDELKSK